MLDRFSVPRPRGHYNQYDTSIKKYIAAERYLINTTKPCPLCAD